MQDEDSVRRFLLSAGAYLAFFGVGFGAFGAHGLKDRVPAEMLTVWQTGAQYNLAHALATVLVASLVGKLPTKQLAIVGYLFIAGVILFSGSLYTLAVTGVKGLGAITPLGGLCFLSGWLTLAVTAQMKNRPT